MNNKMPITWLIDKINDTLSSTTESAASNITTLITPVVSACFGIYIILICFNYMRGAESEPVADFAIRMCA